MTDQPTFIPFPAPSISDRSSGNRPSGGGRHPSQVFFDRFELNRILNIYGRMVAAGKWKDYAIDMMSEEAVFSIFRRASEMPVYRIIKAPMLARRQGAWRIVGMNGQVMKRGHDLKQVLTLFERKFVKLVED